MPAALRLRHGADTHCHSTVCKASVHQREATYRCRVQVEGCCADLSRVPKYQQQHKLCNSHLKASSLVADDQRVRFCQLCNRFQPLSDFDDNRRHGLPMSPLFDAKHCCCTGVHMQHLQRTRDGVC